VTPLSIIVVILVLSDIGLPKLSDRLDRCAPGKTMYCQCGVHHQRITSNVVLSLSHSSALKINESQRRLPKSLSNAILYYCDAGTELRLTLSMFSCLF